MQLVLDTNGLMVKKRNNSFWIIHKEKRRIISPRRIESIAVTADCLLSIAAIRLAADHQIPIYFFNAAGRATARLWGAQFGSIATIRREQVLFALETEASQWVMDLYRLKLDHQLACLKYIQRRRPSKREALIKTQEGMQKQVLQFDLLVDKRLEEIRPRIMGIEGSIARLYWTAVGLYLPKEWTFNQRSRRPARDPFNAMLNYLYGMLYNVLTSAILASGLDPQLGFLHADEYNRPTLSFDMIEPFRPWVDRLLWEKAMDKELLASYVEQRKEGGLTMSKSGKRYIISLFNEWLGGRMVFEGRRLSRKNHIHRFAGEFAQRLLKKAKP